MQLFDVTGAFVNDKSLGGDIPVVTRVLKHMLTFEPSSIGTELVGSILSNVLTKKRFGLSPATVNDLIFVRWNGPSVSQLDARYYA